MQTAHDLPAAFNDSTLEESFTRDGYAVAPFFSPDEIERCKELYFAHVPNSPSDYYTTAYLPIGQPRRNLQQELEKIIAPRAAEFMPGYASCLNVYIVKRGHPNAQPLPLHQDFSFVDHTVNRCVRVWITLVDVDEHNGCMTVLPRSHLLTKHIAAMGAIGTPYDPHRAVLEADCIITVPMKAGEAMFFDERTLHGSYPNTSPALRIAVSAVFLPKDVKPRLYVNGGVTPGHLDILEIDSETLVDYSKTLRRPYPEGFKQIGAVEYAVEPLSEEVVQSLRRFPEPERVARAETPGPVPAALLKPKRGFLSRLFGHP